MTIKDRLESLNTKKIEGYKKAYQMPTASACKDFINRFCFTYDPRSKKKVLPFILYPRQEEYIDWLWDRYKGHECGMVDKARDIGASWLSMAFSVWLLLFQKNTSVGIYSFKADSVDKLGDISTLMGKVNSIIQNLPQQFVEGVISKYFYIKNYNGSDIAGASGDQPDRGGRRSCFFKDESAFYEHPEMIEASLSETSDCIIDISTHQGTNSIFYQKISSGSIPVFVFDWFSNPNHTQELYNQKREKAAAQGMLHIFQREIDRNPGASIDSVVIPMEWAESAKQIEIKNNGKRVAGVDVADAGTDTSAICIVDGNEVLYLDEWSLGDTGETADKSFWKAVDFKCDEYRYDNIGVGAGVKARVRQIKEDIEHKLVKTERDLIALKMKIIGWSAAGAVIRPEESDFDDKENRLLFENAKSQAYWKCREEFRNTYRFTTGKDYDAGKVISFCEVAKSNIFNKFLRELSQPQYKISSSGKIQIDKKPNSSKSPNLNDAYIIARAETSGQWVSWSAV